MQKNKHDKALKYIKKALEIDKQKFVSAGKENAIVKIDVSALRHKITEYQ